jgi:murein DD-endopeptidase MepM/ murein hydrolase activator NlpD
MSYLKHIIILLLLAIIPLQSIVSALDSISDNTKDIDYYDQFATNKIWWNEEIQQIMDMYETISPDEYLNIQQSKSQIQWLYNEIESLSDEFSTIAAQKKTTEMKYNLIREQISKIVFKTRLIRKQIESRADRISMYTKKLNQIQNDLTQIQLDIAQSRKDVAIFANMLYQIHNDYYGDSNQIDDVKLWIKSKNIAQTLWSADMIKIITLQMDELLEGISEKQSNLNVYSKLLNEIRLEYKDDIKQYQDSIEILNQQRDQLIEFMQLYKEDKIRLDKNTADIFVTKQELRNYIQNLIWQIRDQVTNNNISIRPDQALSWHKIVDKSDEGNFFSRPIYPIAKLNSYYQDPIYKLKYGINNPGIDIDTEQFTPIYAPANGIVYKVVNNEGISLNWIIMVHKYWYVTVLMPLNKILVTQGQSIKRGQLIWYAWWEPWTKWAWLLSEGPMLHFEVLKNGKHIDPLSILDLAVVMDKAELPTKYIVKQQKDKEKRGIDLSDVKYMPWDRLSIRRKNFLDTYGYGSFADIRIREIAQKESNVDIDLGICIGFAESGMGRNLSSPWNIGNVGNNDRWDRRSYSGPVAWAKSIYRALMNRMLGKYHTIWDLSGYGNDTGPIYASSKYNREKNVVKCLSTIKWYRVPEDFPFRVNIKKDDTMIYVDPTRIVKAEDRTKNTFTNMMPK